jgi:hypothetical protein
MVAPLMFIMLSLVVPVLLIMRMALMVMSGMTMLRVFVSITILCGGHLRRVTSDVGSRV